jgi:hypothetical protein
LGGNEIAVGRCEDLLTVASEACWRKELVSTRKTTIDSHHCRYFPTCTICSVHNCSLHGVSIARSTQALSQHVTVHLPRQNEGAGAVSILPGVLLTRIFKYFCALGSITASWVLLNIVQQDVVQLFFLALISGVFKCVLLLFFGLLQGELKKRLNARIQYAKFLQDTVGEMAKELKTSRSGDLRRTADELDDFIKKVCLFVCFVLGFV